MNQKKNFLDFKRNYILSNCVKLVEMSDRIQFKSEDFNRIFTLKHKNIKMLSTVLSSHWDGVLYFDSYVAEDWMKGIKDKNNIIQGNLSPELMDGDNDLEKALNCYLCSQFILNENLPADECLSDAKEIIAVIKKYYDID